MPAQTPAVGMERKLAAIFSTDVAGYSRLMGEDEEATIHTLTAYRQIITALIQHHRGRVVDSPGDNLLAEFASVVDAVRCAVEIQHELKGKNAELPEHRQMRFRIGINLGDVVVEGERIYGDGVNIAARLEGLAEPGGICISGIVHDQVANRLGLAFDYLGEKTVKNIAKPVPAYRVLMEPGAAASAAIQKEETSAGEAGQTLPGQGGTTEGALPRSWQTRMQMLIGVLLILSGSVTVWHFYLRPPSLSEVAPSEQTQTLAVLPFHVLTVPEEIGYLGIGIPDAIITRLANIRKMRVRPTSAILRYENQTLDLQEVGRALKTESVLSGTVQKVSERFRVSVQLVRVSDGVPLWGEHYDLAYSDLLGLQDAIAEQIAATFKIRLTAAERAQVYRRYTENNAAYQLYLLGRSHQVRYTKDGTRAAVEAFEAALRLDPSYALAHAGLATASAQMRIRFVPEAEVKTWEERAKQEARSALDLDPDLAEAHEALAAVHRNTEFDWEGTIVESTQALELNPNLDLPHLYRAAAFFHLGVPELVEREVRAAMDINPGNRVEPLRVHGTAALFDSRFTEAVSLLEEAQHLSEALTAGWYLAQAYYYRGQRERAETMLAQLRGSGQVERRAQATLASFLAARGERVKAKELLRTVTEGTYMDHHVAYSLGVTYAQLGQHDEALRWLRNAADTGFPCFPWYTHDPLLQPLRGNAEFQRLLEDLRQVRETTKRRHALEQENKVMREREEEDRAAATEVLRINPQFSLEVLRQWVPYTNPAVIERQVVALRKTG